MERNSRKTNPKARERTHQGRVVDLRPGSGWHKRNFLAEVLIPSLFQKRMGKAVKPVFPQLREDEFCITWIGHASFLIQTHKHSLLIDPNWAKWLKIIKRIRHPGIEIRDLPQIDLVLITHAHFDHLDRRTLRAVAANQPILVPRDVGGLVHNLGFDRVHEMECWEAYERSGLKITMTPAAHWGARMLHDQHRGFGGFVIEYAGRSIFHAGDSAYFEGFREIGNRFAIDVALLPIGAYDPPRARDVHMSPEQAVQAFMELNAKTLVPMHYGTFRLSYEPPHEPPMRLFATAKKHNIHKRLRLLLEGEPEIF